MTEPVTSSARVADADTPRRRCWNCAADPAGASRCPECGKLQPLGTQDYFAVMGLPRKLAVDLAPLERRFHELSRQYHPDFYRTGPTRERLVALENASLVNRAYKTLRDPAARAEYLVQLEGGEAGEIKSNPPQALFEEILEIQELLTDYQTGDPNEQAALRPQLAAKLAAVRDEYAELARRLTQDIFTRWDTLPEDASPDAKQRILTEIRTILGNRGYLRRVVDSLTAATGGGVER